MAHPFERVALYETIKASRKVQDKNEAIGWSTTAVLAKMMEECGEFSEATLIAMGLTRHKEMEVDDPLLEAADVIICLMDALQRLYPKKAPDELYVSLSAAIDRKRERWIDGPKGVNQTFEREYGEVLE
jgi:hypothetical protein